MTIPEEPTPTHSSQPAPQQPGAQQPAPPQPGATPPSPQGVPPQANPQYGNPYAPGSPYPTNAPPQQPVQQPQPAQQYTAYGQPQQPANPAYPPYGQVPSPGNPYPYPAGVLPDEKRELAPARVRIMIPSVWAAAALTVISAIVTMATTATSLPGLTPRQSSGVQAVSVLAGGLGLLVQIGLYTLVLILLQRRRPVARVLATVFASIALVGNLVGFVIALSGGMVLAAVCDLLVCAVCIAFLIVAWRPLREPQAPGLSGV